ncbi:unnamed protein product [Leptosia nina]|uniref:Attacin n=1 Tax=Leptosia nina TaxID=320188 RepID=A0AAV1JGE4_9NEOP
MYIFALILITGVQSRFVSKHEEWIPPPFHSDLEDVYFEKNFESVKPVYLKRIPRQVQGVTNTNPDGSSNWIIKTPIAGNDKNVLSGVGGIYGVKNGDFNAALAGLSLDNLHGHSASITGKHIKNFGNQLTAAGKLNLLHNDRHDLSAHAFGTRTFPNNPMIPNFNTVGGGVDYTFNNKIGASLGMSHTDLLKRTDYSAMGNLNIFRNPTSSLDFNAGATKSISPFLPKSNWQPNFGISYIKYF